MDILLVLENYLVHGWLFALIHLGLAVLVIQKSRSIDGELQGLKSWIPGDAGKTECTGVLAQFVEESEHWGRHGILVPSTDFTDRLDSRVSGLIDGISSLVNLFLVVGVAGTFVGLFDFAQAMATQLNIGGDPTGLIGSSLSSGLAKALPVSIVGIFFTISGHIFVSILEARLKSAVTGATQRAMKYRRQSSTSLAEAIREAMDPFKDIAKVMGEQITPVINVFLERVEGSMTRIGESLGPFSIAVSTFNESSVLLSTAVSGLKGAVESSEAHLREVQKSRDRLTLRTTELLKRMEKLEGVMSDAANDLKDGAGHIRNVAGGMAEAVRSSLGELKGSVGEQWSTACGQYFQALEPVRASLLASTDQLNRAGSALGDGFREGLADLTKTATKTWQELSEGLISNEENRLAGLNNGLVNTNTKLSEAAAAMVTASTHANSIMVNGTATIVRQIFVDYESTLNQIQLFLRNDVPPMLETLTLAGREVRKMRDETKATADRFISATATAVSTTSNFSGSVDRLSSSVESVDGRISELTATVARLEAVLDGRLAPVRGKADKGEDLNGNGRWWGLWRGKK